MSRTRVLRGDAYARARLFVEQQGRLLEAARLGYHFDGESQRAVLEALVAFRNPDGGFGHAIEPDLRAPESSAIGTSVALQILREIGVLRDAEMADGARKYLLETLDRELASWRIVPACAEKSPHAPWWNQTGRDHGYDRFSLNPTAELLGYLCEWGRPEDGEVVQLVSTAVIHALGQSNELEMHDLLCVLRLFRAQGLPGALREALDRTVPDFVDRAVVCDSEAWQTYGLRPLQVVDGPASPFLPGLEQAVESNLDHLVETQGEDGSWAPTWSWGEVWPEVWTTARGEWSGVLTLGNLLSLNRFGRLRMLNGR